MKKINKLTLIVALGILPLLQANAAGVVQVGNGLYVPNYTSQELTGRGCDPNNWNTLVNNYVTKRTNERQVEKAQTDQYIQQTPTAQGANGGVGACFQNAVSTINNTISQANQVLSIFSGGFDLGALASNLGNQFANAACQQVNYYVGQQVNRVTAPITGGINTGIGNVNTGIQGAVNGTGINGVNGVGAVQGSVTPNNSNNIPYINTNTVNNAVSGVTGTSGANTGSFFSKMNPFRSSDTQQVPDSLK